MFSLWCKYKETIFRIFELLCYVFVISAAWFCIEIFIWQREIYFQNPKYIADANILGNFGDFMAGTLGCVIAAVSMYLLFRTLKSQRAATISNSNLMTVQRFNDLFFRLIDLYRQLSNDLVIPANTRISVDNRRSIVNDIERRDKDFFDKWRSAIEIGGQTATTFDDINRQTLKHYQNFYVQNRNKLGAYFRTLYRIIELIDLSNISNEEKRNYSKILRAQLSESELFMLFYNSQTDLGQKLGKYLWEYHILKHLPIYETVEFQKLYPNLIDTENEEIDRIYSLLLSSTKKIVRKYNGKALKHSVENEHFIIDFECKPNGYDSKTCQVNLSVKANKMTIYSREPHLSQFTPEDWSKLFSNMLSLINLFSKHTIFSCQSRYIIPKVPKHIFLFSLISYRDPHQFH